MSLSIWNEHNKKKKKISNKLYQNRMLNYAKINYLLQIIVFILSLN